MSFYSNFLNQCAKKYVSASGAAAAIGLSNAAASGWKNGKVPKDVTLRNLAAYFGCTVEDLLKEEKPAPDGNELSKKEQLLNLINGMSRAELIDTIQTLVAKLDET